MTPAQFALGCLLNVASAMKVIIPLFIAFSLTCHIVNGWGKRKRAKRMAQLVNPINLVGAANTHLHDTTIRGGKQIG
jgi:hypothetical protein